MPLDIDAYLTNTVHLSAAEHGAYILLIMRYWKDRGLPEDERLIARYSRLGPEQWAESRDTLAAFFHDGWKHERIDEELAKADDIVTKRRNAANTKHEQSTSRDVRVPPRTNNQESSSLRSEDSAPAKKPSPRERLEVVLDAEHAEGVIEHRQRLRKPLTERAAKGLAEQLAKFPDPNAAADRMILKGWASIEPGWGEGPPSQAGPVRRGNPLMAAIDALPRGHDERSQDPAEASVRYLPATVTR